MNPAPPLADLLVAAARMVQGVQAGRSIADALAALPAALRPGAQALAFDALRRLGGAQAALAELAPRAPPKDEAALLAVAIALAWPRRDGQPTAYADHTLVDQAVLAVREGLAAPRAAGFVNAVLRRFLRERPAVVERAESTEPGALNHPAWWIERVRRDWPDRWRALLEAARERPPMALRVNARRTTAQAYAQRLADAGIGAAAAGTHAVVLDAPRPVHEVPGFAQGDVSVQDLAAQRAAPLLLGSGPAPGARVLDACAAPGGKTAHLLELAPDLELLALDSDAPRLQRVRETLERLQLTGATLLAADAREPAAWWDGRPFDAILLDAPCSASGIVRRHPDIPWLRRPGDIASLARTQGELLDALWPLVAPGGRLLYATCSLFHAEGQAQIDAFLQRQGPGSVRLDTASPGHLPGVAENASTTTAAGPAMTSEDAFFYALLHRPR
jgi:16S rRNA (cytosine967-C5)-methyltransferase